MLKISLRIAARSLTIIRRTVLAIFLLLVFSFAGLILTLRYAVLPDIEQYHDEITLAVAQAVGQRVEIGKIEADWYGMNPHLRLSEIRILDKQQQTTLALQRVDIVLSWLTLLTAELRLASLEIDQPDLLVKRDLQGVLKISGVQIEEGATDNNFANLLLNQSRIVVRDARISWLNEQQGTPLLVFEQVNLVIENDWNRHRISVRALPPKALSTQLDVRADLYGKSFDDLNSWSGEIFTQLDYADLAAWKTWLPVPAALKHGKGALRAWLEVKQGKFSRVTTDLALADVQTRLAEDLPALDLRLLSGRLGWRDVNQGVEIFTRNFSLQLANNFVLKPTDAFFRLNNTAQSSASSGEIRANLLELEGLVQLIEYLPLENQYKTRLTEFSPQGSVSNLQAKWQIGSDKQLHYSINGQFHELSLKPVGKLPGFSGLSGELAGNENRGTLSLTATKVTFDAPHFMPEPLAFDTLTAQSNWHTNDASLEVSVRHVAVSNADVEGSAYGSYQTLPDSPGKLDLTVHMKRASVRHTAKYIPLIAIPTDVHSWLKTALLAGESNDFNLRLKGDMNDFPFVGNKKGIFKVQARTKGVTVAYSPEWPNIENANAELLINGNELKISASSATTAGIPLKNAVVSIADMLSSNVTLSVRGESEGELARILEYIHVSPIRGYLAGLTDDIIGQGKGKLKLKLDVPLSAIEASKVAGSYHFIDAEADFGKNLPTARKVKGELNFTESAVSANNITGIVLGGPAKLVIATGEVGEFNVKIKGRANIGALRESNQHPLLRRLNGDPEWRVEIGIKNKQSKILLTSSLLGLQSDLPEPFAKQAERAMPLRVEMNSLSSQQNVSTVHYGSLLNANILSQKDASGAWHVARGAIHFSGVAPKAEREGLWFTGAIPQLSLEGWGGLTDPDGDAAPVSVAGGDFLIQKLTGYGNSLSDVQVKANRRSGVLNAQIAGKEVAGELSWRSPGLTLTGASEPARLQSADHGRLLVRLKNLALEKLGDENNSKKQPEKNLTAALASYADLPVIDLAIERLSLKEKPLGKLELLAQHHEKNYQLDHFLLSNPDGVLSLTGKLQVTEDAPQTQINLKLDINNAGNILTRSGYPDTVKNGKGKLEGTLSWPGTPEMLSNASMSGTLTLNTSKGQFLQLEPGIGKLLSILNLQALPKRMTLDFTDVFSKGFEFDEITGSAEIKKGVMFTDNLKIEGSSAKVSMKGQVDLTTETQDLRVRVVPAVGNTAAMITLATVANPIVGVGVFIAGKLLGDPLGQLLSFEYNVTGSWVDPKVEKAK